MPLPQESPGSVFLISEAGGILKLPIPSNSIRDPLNWPTTTRIAAFCALTFHSTISLFQIRIPGALNGALELEFDPEGTGAPNIQLLSTVMGISTTVGYLLSAPLTTAVGRRPVMLSACVINALSTISAAVAPGYSGLIVSIWFQGLALGLTLCVGLLIVLDATFIYERPYALSIMWCVLTGLMNVLRIAVPYITNTAINWRPVYQALISPFLLSLILVFFLVPESFFLRPPVALDGRILVQGASETVKIYDNWEALPDTEMARKGISDSLMLSVQWERLKVCRAPGTSFKAAGAVCMQMLYCLCNPLLIWVCLLGGTLLCSMIFMGYIRVMNLNESFDDKDAETIGLYLKICGSISAILAFPATGPLLTWATRYFATRSGGVRHSEVYLTGFVIPVLAGAMSIGLYGAGAAHHWPPSVQYIISTLANFSFICGYITIVLWITEAFPAWAAASLAIELAAVDIIASLLAIPLGQIAQESGILSPSMILVVLILVLGAIAIPLAFWGQDLRQRINGKWGACEKGALRPQ